MDKWDLQWGVQRSQRYHARPALVEGADNHHFLIWATGGAVVLVMHAALNPQQHVDLDGLFLQWLGLLLLWFALAGWIRRRRPGVFRWKPSHGPEWMPRPSRPMGCALASWADM